MISRRLYSTIESSKKVLASLSNPNLVKTEAYINGAWVSSSSGETFAVTNPALYPSPSSELATVQSMSTHDFNTAIESAHAAFAQFKHTTGRHRSDLLLRLYHLMLSNKEDLAKLVVLENGKPYADALGEVAYAASFFQWFAEEAPRVYGDIIPSANATNRILTFKQPVGVCGIMTPWNFPLAMITRKLGAAVAAGCTTVVKPASETPLSAAALAVLADEAGFPAGVINVLPSADAAGVGKLITEHPLISKVSFTGSTPVGKLLMGQAASTLKKLSFELGGNAPFIVFEDVDVDKAVTGAIASKFRSSGQTCVCANRLFVHEKVYDEFARKLVERLNRDVVLGNGLDPKVNYGPVIHDRSMKKVRQHIDDAVSKGAKVLFGGNKRPDLGENFHELTVLGDVTTEMLIANEETFGPVAPLIKFSSDEEVISMANDTNVGLAGYFFANDITKVFKIAEALNVGMMGVNTGAISESALPFGGVAESGFGREGSKYGINDYLIIKSAVLGDIQ
ncbi:Succinate-semialdehyde dehydrogenase [NADP(+)] [Candida viswanathii]|uniref:Succinate-semialdehyde dehydrogenase n=1 Tax=Candida viswanathii TaxID=5486 RepID=A0A367XR37_9ASCO|nr:Succinate-semialdehyde dehydrogenase [NADP(+)] [Candida viswanathii]